MAHLTLARVSDDGKRLVLVSEEGVEFTVDIDARLRAALRGDQDRPGQRESRKKMDSALRPRDIQARIRAGESPEAVAEAAQMPVEKVMPFAAPVLAEREHVADRAQRSSVRGASVRRGEGAAAGGARTLGDAVATHLRSVNVDPESVEWDAWRREDGRWSLVASYSSVARAGTAEFVFDVPGNYVTLENDEARWLVGEAVPEQPGARDDLRQARQRRLSAVHPDDAELPLGEDAIELVTGDLGAEQPVEAFLDPEPPAEEEPRVEEAERRQEATDAAADERADPEPAPPARRPVKKTRGRASVPSWDEIMFGGGGKE